MLEDRHIARSGPRILVIVALANVIIGTCARLAIYRIAPDFGDPAIDKKFTPSVVLKCMVSSSSLNAAEILPIWLDRELAKINRGRGFHVVVTSHKAGRVQ